MATDQEAGDEGNVVTSKPPLPLYSMRRLQRILGVNRTKLVGMVAGMDLQTYEGPRESILVDDRGLKALTRKLGLDLTPARD